MSGTDADRISELLDKLVRRAHACPGLMPAPLQTREDFLALARWQAGDGPDAAVACVLEMLWRDPAEGFVWVNRLLLQAGGAAVPAAVPPSAGSPAWESTLRAALSRHRRAA